MPIIRRLTRAGLRWDAFLEPSGRRAKAAALGVLHLDLAVTLNGAGVVVAGLAPAAGVAPRLSAAVLAGLFTLGGSVQPTSSGAR